MACLFRALHISDLSQQSEKYFAEKARNINIPLRREYVYRKPRIFIYFFCQPHEYLLGLTGKSETKKEPRDISARKCPCSHLVSLSRVACFTWHSVLCILCTAGMKLTCQHIFRSGEMFQSNGRLLSRLGLGGGGCLCSSHVDGSNQMFLSFEKRPGGHVCRGLHGVRALYQGIAAALQFSLSLCVTVLLFSTQFIMQFVWAVYSADVSDTEGGGERLASEIS